MESEIVSHQSIALDWNSTINILNPQTLVLGSFNPYKNPENSVDYYYGRVTNHFWKSIAIIHHLDEMWFFDNDQGLERKKEVMNNSFICFDVIDSINISCNNRNELRQYINGNIFNNFLDSKIWTSKTKSSNGELICLIRNYNQTIINYLQQNNSIRKIIHTMGVNRLSYKKAKPKEKVLNEIGFEGYINQILQICQDKNIEFIFESFSPSDYAIKSGKVNRFELEGFLRDHIPF